MPINKETSARLVKQKIPYDIISRDVVQSITNPVALAIYTYLLTKPENWTVRRTDILNHFDGLGRDRYDDAMRQLKSIGICWVANVRGEQGQFQDQVIMIEALPPEVGKPAIRENPQAGKSDHIEIQRLPRDTDTYIHKGFKPPTVKEVQEYSSTIDAERFCDFYESKGWMVGKNKMKDFKAAIRNWERNNDKRDNQSKAGGNTGQPERKLTPAQRTAAKRKALGERNASNLGAMATNERDVRTPVGLTTRG
tara:strand:+ start:673 stop:1428 length:756 start_codon:yes stop_codon:yes gene_type:complete